MVRARNGHYGFNIGVAIERVREALSKCQTWAMALVGPMIAMVMIAVMAVLLHRSLRASEPPPIAAEPAREKPRDLQDTGSMPDDYGLLAPAAVTRTRADALLVKEQ